MIAPTKWKTSPAAAATPTTGSANPASTPSPPAANTNPMGRVHDSGTCSAAATVTG